MLIYDIRILVRFMFSRLPLKLLGVVFLIVSLCDVKDSSPPSQPPRAIDLYSHVIVCFFAFCYVCVL
jgi:hypothetical protein